MKLGDLAARLGGSVVGDPGVEITGVGEPAGAGPGMIVYAAHGRALRVAEQSAAAAVLVPADLPPGQKPAIQATNARLAFARLLELFAPPRGLAPGIHPTAVIGAAVVLGQDVHIGPHVVLGDRVRIGARSALLAATVVGQEVIIGDDCTLYPHVTIRDGCALGNRVILHPGVVIGSDGFGYAQGEAAPVKIPHLGRVVIEDDVEIGANTTIDRATLGETRVGQHTKIDNLVQIGHNVKIGRNVTIVAETGIGGSTTIGDYVVLAGQVGVRDHVHIGERATVLAAALVSKDVRPGEVISGSYTLPRRDELRLQALLRRLPWLFEQVAALARRLADQGGRPAPGKPKKR